MEELKRDMKRRMYSNEQVSEGVLVDVERDRQGGQRSI